LRYVEKKATGKITTTLSESRESKSNFSDTQSQATGAAGQTGRMSAMSGPHEGEITSKKVTETKPFNLTKPKPKVIPRP